MSDYLKWLFLHPATLAFVGATIAIVLSEVPRPPREAPAWKRIAWRFLWLLGAGLRVAPVAPALVDGPPTPKNTGTPS